jgi:hypothetical protein
VLDDGRPNGIEDLIRTRIFLSIVIFGRRNVYLIFICLGLILNLGESNQPRSNHQLTWKTD